MGNQRRLVNVAAFQSLFTRVFFEVVGRASVFQLGHSGQVSALTTGLVALGCGIRVLTTIEEVGDTIIVLSTLCIFVLNLFLFFQVLTLQKSDKKVL